MHCGGGQQQQAEVGGLLGGLQDQVASGLGGVGGKGVGPVPAASHREVPHEEESAEGACDVLEAQEDRAPAGVLRVRAVQVQVVG